MQSSNGYQPVFTYLFPAICLVAANLLTGCLTADEQKASALLDKAQSAAAAGQHAKAVELAQQAVAIDGKLSSAYYLLGREHFRSGNAAESVKAFDKYVALRPAAASRQWERGISCYYARQFRAGADQFALYQTYHDNDVENSTWRYLCVARADNVARAKRKLLPIKNDTRIPMMAIYKLYRGEIKPAAVLAAARAGQPSAQDLAARMFYADLYLGLYYEVNGQPELARKHILAAAANDKPNPRVNRYMWDVAAFHARQLKAASHQIGADGKKP